MISIIIRTKNEERWIKQCLLKIKDQEIDDKIEVILVDNNSNDKTVERALKVCPSIKIVTIKEFTPGRAINEGIKKSSGDYIVCLSAHCIPVRKDWLKMLKDNFKSPDVAGVYGRQLPTEQTGDSDRRDLIVTFGLDRRVQKKDPFFHNANSMFKRSVWEKYPFDENVPNIEDRVWGDSLTSEGYCLIYEPDAPVYHYHGIHHNLDTRRVKNVVRIIEDLGKNDTELVGNGLYNEKLDILALIPLRAAISDNIGFNDELVLETLNTVKQSRFINRIVVLTDSQEIERKAVDWEVEIPFLRPSELSDSSVRVNDVLKWALDRFEEQDYLPDLVLPLEITYPFREEGLLDNLIKMAVKGGYDTVITGFPEYRPAWIEKDGEMVQVNELIRKRSEREPVHVSLHGLGCVTYPDVIRNGSRIGVNVGIYQLRDFYSTIEVRTKDDLSILRKLKELKKEK